MFVLSNFFIALAKATDLIFEVMKWFILIRALLSWVNPDPFNPIVQILHRMTEPILSPIRRILPPMGIDLSPMIAFIVILFLKAFLVQTLFDIGLRVR